MGMAPIAFASCSSNPSERSESKQQYIHTYRRKYVYVVPFFVSSPLLGLSLGRLSVRQKERKKKKERRKEARDGLQHSIRGMADTTRYTWPSPTHTNPLTPAWQDQPNGLHSQLKLFRRSLSVWLAARADASLLLSLLSCLLVFNSSATYSHPDCQWCCICQEHACSL